MNDTFRTALITGASSGIGFALTKKIAPFCSTLLLCGRDAQALESLRNEVLFFCENVQCIVGDLAHEEHQNQLVDSIFKHTPDLIIQSAGIGFYGDETQVTIEEEMRIIDLNVKACVRLTIEGAKAMKQKSLSGVICNISSALAFFPTPFMSVYAASKAFLNSFSLAQDEELKPFGIRVLTSCPGKVMTQFRSRAAKEKKSHETPSFFVMKKEEVAEEIWQQIIKRKRLKVINAWVQMLTFLGRLLPQKLLLFIMGKAMKKLSS